MQKFKHENFFKEFFINICSLKKIAVPPGGGGLLLEFYFILNSDFCSGLL
jgi:hypothetical protein